MGGTDSELGVIELEIGSGDKETDGQTGIGAGGIEGEAETETKEETEGKRGGAGKDRGGNRRARERVEKWKSKRAGQKCLARPFYFEINGQC